MLKKIIGVIKHALARLVVRSQGGLLTLSEEI